MEYLPSSQKKTPTTKRKTEQMKDAGIVGGAGGALAATTAVGALAAMDALAATTAVGALSATTATTAEIVEVLRREWVKWVYSITYNHETKLINQELKMPTLNVKHYNPSPEYLKSLVRQTGLSEKQAAEEIGVTYSALRSWTSGRYQHSYPVQFALECLISKAEKQQ